MARAPLLRLLWPFALGIGLEDAVGLAPRVAVAFLSGLCMAVLLALWGWSVGSLSTRCARGVLRGCELCAGVALGALVLSVRLHAPVPAPGSDAVAFRVLSAPKRVGPQCRAEIWIGGRAPGRASFVGPGASCSWLPGQIVFGRLRSSAFRPRTNPGGRDPRRLAARRGIHRRVALSGQSFVLAAEPRTGTATLERIRRRLADSIDPPDSPSRSGAVLRALVGGQRDRISPAVRQIFVRSGTAHLLAVSGLHIGCMFIASQFVLGRVVRRTQRAGLLRNVRRICVCGGVLVAVFYASLTGFGVPVLRSVLMASAGVLAVVGGRQGAPLNALALAALVVLSLDPSSLFSASLWLSFSAVLGILVWEPPARGWTSLAHTSAAAGLATAPFVAGLGGPLSLLWLPANWLAVPFFGVLVVPLGFVAALSGASVPALAHLVRAPALAATELGIRMLEMSSGPDLLSVAQRPIYLAAALTSSGFALRMLACRGRSPLPLWLAALAAAAIGMALAPCVSRQLPERSILSLISLDVGHGDAILLRSRRSAWLVDAGGRFGSFDAGQDVVLPALAALGVRALDVLVITHADRDHIGGAAALAEHLRLGEIWLSAATAAHRGARPLLTRAAREHVPVRVVSAGYGARLGMLDVEVLWPEREASRLSGNAGSLVLAVRGHGACALLTGDAPSWVERRLVPRLSHCPLLKLGHHGSASSTSNELVARLDPWVAVTSAGARARAPLPAESVRARLHARSVSLYETLTGGAIRAEFTRDGLVLAPFLKTIWHAELKTSTPGPARRR